MRISDGLMQAIRAQCLLEQYITVSSQAVIVVPVSFFAAQCVPQAGVNTHNARAWNRSRAQRCALVGRSTCRHSLAEL
jgi:hypothetical protein